MKERKRMRLFWSQWPGLDLEPRFFPEKIDGFVATVENRPSPFFRLEI
jgi:hypothetical protein